jgi:hypothetical protein
VKEYGPNAQALRTKKKINATTRTPPHVESIADRHMVRDVLHTRCIPGRIARKIPLPPTGHRAGQGDILTDYTD